MQLFAVQPFASVTVTQYIPSSWLMTFEVSTSFKMKFASTIVPFLVQLNEYGGVPLVTVTLIEPLLKLGKTGLLELRLKLIGALPKRAVPPTAVPPDASVTVTAILIFPGKPPMT